eukprot:971484-Amphidinium_carterae.1
MNKTSQQHLKQLGNLRISIFRNGVVIFFIKFRVYLSVSLCLPTQRRKIKVAIAGMWPWGAIVAWIKDACEDSV